MTDLASIVRKQLIKDLAAKQITCPRTDQVLDAKTAVVLLDKHDDPAFLFSQDGWAEMGTSPAVGAILRKKEWHVDESTVRK